MGCLIAANVLIFIYSKKLFFYNEPGFVLKKRASPLFTVGKALCFHVVFDPNVRALYDMVHIFHLKST